MSRPLRVAGSLLLLSLALSLAGCHTPPPRLELQDAFAARYEGWLRPLAAEDPAFFAEEPATDAGDGANVTFRATAIELPMRDAYELVPELLMPRAVGHSRAPSPANGATPAADDAPADPHTIGVASGRVDPDSLRAALDSMQRGPYASWSVYGVTRVGGVAVLTDTNQTAFVKSLRYLRPGAPIVDDLEVASFRSGNRLRLAPTPRADGLHLDIDWLERTPVHPIPLARGRHATVQVPVFEHHRLSTSAPLAERDAFVVASLPGRAPGTVQLLCIEVDACESRVATR